VDPAAILSAAKSFRIVDVVAALNGNCAGAGTAAFCPGSEKTESAWEKRDGHADRTVNRVNDPRLRQIRLGREIFSVLRVLSV
jgi:hypothetical protein